MRTGESQVSFWMDGPRLCSELWILLVFGANFLKMELNTSTNFPLADGTAFRARQLALFMEFLLLYKLTPLCSHLLSGICGR